ncbi:MAG: tetratricopeptide repeat protein, partial [Burkholderiaceae bacterium]|nr:tetratricopeptide repeat protein [Burkholderiaceae bacterium]
WRVDWLRGVAARDARRLDEALARLQAARRLAPAERAPVLDLAVTHEWRGETRAARALYDDLLRAQPDARDALLGTARVARAQGRTADARAIYERLLQRDAADIDAINGLGWADLADLRLDEAKQRFDEATARSPGNPEASEGLSQLEQQWRYRIELLAGRSSLSAGDTGTALAGLLINRNSTDQVELVLGRNGRELPAERLTDPTPLPSWTARVGYRSRTEGGLDWATAYEWRDRSVGQTEQRVELRVGSRFTGAAQRLQWFASVRQGFPAPWRNRLASVGLAADVAPHWSVAGTFYAGESALGGGSKAIAFDAYRETGAMGSFLNVGVGYSPEPDNTSVHARWVLPIAPRQALVFSVERRSLGREVEALVGWRTYWR